MTPAYLSIPPRRGSYGDEAVDLARLARPREQWPDEKQQVAIDALLSYGPGGRWAALEGATLESRQNGKTTGELEPVVLFDLYMLPPDRIVWTAHRFRTARDAFADFVACIEYSDVLSRRTKKVSFSHGEEYIETTAGAKLEFLAREHGGGGRGLGGKRVVFDEALILEASAMGAILPVLSARDDPQVNYGSSAAKKTSSQLHRLIKRGRSGTDPSLIYVECRADGSWSDPPCDRGSHCTHSIDMPGCALDDEQRWAQANHTLGTRITHEYVRAERRALPPIEFGRERLGWEEVAVDESALIDMDAWALRLDPDSMAAGKVCFALDANPDRTMSAIGMTGKRADGTRHRQVLEHRPGMSWVVGRAKELDGEVANVGWAVDPSSPAGALIPELEQAGLTVHQLSARDTAHACGSMLSGATDDSGWHIGQAALDQAWRDARTSASGDGVRFARRKSTGDITPLMVVTLSDHGFRVHGEGDSDPWFLVGS